jgi:L-cysteine desulfidase
MNSSMMLRSASKYKLFFDILEKELVVALGCTEPVAIAYVAALAKEQLKGKIDAVQVALSGNMIKNAMAVIIPGTTECGIKLSVALGIIAGDSAKKLEVLSGVTQKDVDKAKMLIESGNITLSVADTNKKLYVEIIAHSGEEYARVVLTDEHTKVTLIESNGRTVFRHQSTADVDPENTDECAALNIDKIWEFVMRVDAAELELVKKSIELNKQVALNGLVNAYGLQVGKTLYSGIRKGYLNDDFATRAMALTAAGSDARMAGVSLPVVSNSGSGNQGLCATLPVVAVGEKLEADEESILRAVALSHLVTIYIKSKFGRLSALCGAAVAGTGASCGITYLLGGDLKQTKYAIQNMLGNVTGVLCDGAKAGCAMKVSTCVSAAVQSAIMALEERCIQKTDGIIENDVENTIENLCRLGNYGSVETDQVILDIMINKRDAKKVL